MRQDAHDFLTKLAAGLLFTLVACLLPLSGGALGEPVTGAEERLLHDLISTYFSSWSKPDMSVYKSCFHPQATVYFLDAAGKPHRSLLDEFMAGQERVQLQGPKPMTERPTHTTLSLQGRLARAEVRWKLHKNGATETGTDFFTFIRTDTGWQIISLVFELDKKQVPSRP
jgi:Putative lumazine-binding